MVLCVINRGVFNGPHKVIPYQVFFKSVLITIAVFCALSVPDRTVTSVYIHKFRESRILIAVRQVLIDCYLRRFGQVRHHLCMNFNIRRKPFYLLGHIFMKVIYYRIVKLDIVNTFFVFAVGRILYISPARHQDLRKVRISRPVFIIKRCYCSVSLF